MDRGVNGAPEDASPLPLPARLLGAARAAVFSSCAISAGPRAHMSQRRLWFWFERDRVMELEIAWSGARSHGTPWGECAAQLHHERNARLLRDAA